MPGTNQSVPTSLTRCRTSIGIVIVTPSRALPGVNAYDRSSFRPFDSQVSGKPSASWPIPRGRSRAEVYVSRSGCFWRVCFHQRLKCPADTMSSGSRSSKNAKRASWSATKPWVRERRSTSRACSSSSSFVFWKRWRSGHSPFTSAWRMNISRASIRAVSAVSVVDEARISTLSIGGVVPDEDALFDCSGVLLLGANFAESSPSLDVSSLVDDRLRASANAIARKSRPTEPISVRERRSDAGTPSRPWAIPAKEPAVTTRDERESEPASITWSPKRPSKTGRSATKVSP